MKKDTIYRIYDYKLNIWSYKDSFTWSSKPGVGWRLLGHVKSHITMIMNQSYIHSKLKRYKRNCELIEYELKEVARYPLSDFIGMCEKKKEEENKKWKENVKRLQKERRHKDYLNLKKEFE